MQMHEFSNIELEAQIRTVVKDGKPLVSAQDAAKMLGYGKTAALLQRIPEHQVVELTRAELGLRPGSAIRYLTEGGLYRAILRSNMSTAAEFQDWVTDEVLPTIRKKGGYISENANQEQLEELKAEANKRIGILLEQVSDLKGEVNVLNGDIQELNFSKNDAHEIQRKQEEYTKALQRWVRKQVGYVPTKQEVFAQDKRAKA